MLKNWTSEQKTLKNSSSKGKADRNKQDPMICNSCKVGGHTTLTECEINLLKRNVNPFTGFAMTVSQKQWVLSQTPNTVSTKSRAWGPSLTRELCLRSTRQCTLRDKIEVASHHAEKKMVSSYADMVTNFGTKLEDSGILLVG